MIPKCRFPIGNRNAAYRWGETSIACFARRESIVSQFTKAGEFHYACLIPGHPEAGMIAKITVEPKR